jgi:hypothetical protein
LAGCRALRARVQGRPDVGLFNRQAVESVCLQTETKFDPKDFDMTPFPNLKSTSVVFDALVMHEKILGGRFGELLQHVDWAS